MNLTHAVADLHGSHDLLDQALEAIQEHATVVPAGSRTAVFLGDYVDRGPANRQIVERLMAGAPEGWRWICLKGNHEDMIVQTLREPLAPGWWIGNGGGATLVSYGHPLEGAYQPEAVPVDHIEWTENPALGSKLT